MNEDSKKKLKEKLGSLVTDEQLNKVAGGTYQENLEILSAMARLDPKGVQSVFAKVNDRNNHDSPELTISQGAEELLDKHFPVEFGFVHLTSTKDNNLYRKSWKKLSHSEMLKMINDKADEAQGF